MATAKYTSFDRPQGPPRNECPFLGQELTSFRNTRMSEMDVPPAHGAAQSVTGVDHISWLRNAASGFRHCCRNRARTAIQPFSSCHVLLGTGASVSSTTLAKIEGQPQPNCRKQDVLSEKYWDNVSITVVQNSASRQPDSRCSQCSRVRTGSRSWAWAILQIR